MFWIICAALTAVVAIAVAAPLMRRGSGTEAPAAAYDLRVYRDQLREVGRDLERRLIEPAEAERLRTEIGRKVLAADRALERQAERARAPGGPLAVAVLLALLGGAFLLYRDLGAPQRPDEPIATRIAAAQARYDARPTQAQAEAAAPKVQRPQPDAEYLRLIEELRAAVAANPNDPRGLELLALHEERLGNLAAARKAQEDLVALRGTDATAADHARLAALMAEAAGGLITPEAEAQMARALQLDPRDPQARFMAGLLQIQNGRPDRAFPVWAALLAEGPADAPWLAPIRASIQDLAWFAGQPGYTPPEPSGTALPGPDAEAMAAAEAMTPEDRRRMVEGMVEGLETRLATQGGTPDEWARLIGALVVIGRQDHARDILAEARARFAATPEALAVIAEAAGKAGLE